MRSDKNRISQTARIALVFLFSQVWLSCGVYGVQLDSLKSVGQGHAYSHRFQGMKQAIIMSFGCKDAVVNGIPMQVTSAPESQLVRAMHTRASANSCQSKHVDAEVLEKVLQAQSSNLSTNGVPPFYFGPTKLDPRNVDHGKTKPSVASLLRRVVQRKQAQERLSEVIELLGALQHHSGDTITHGEFHKVRFHHGSIIFHG